jgi:hypothetical protein
MLLYIFFQLSFMGLGNHVLLPTGEKRAVADNQIPYHLNCPIDGTQLAERKEYWYTAYDCVTCKISYSVRRLMTESTLQGLARFELANARIKLKMIEEEKGKLLWIIELAEKNSFK